MKKFIKIFIFILITILYYSSAYADWNIIRYVETKNKDKHKLKIEINEDGQFYASFILKRRIKNVFKSKLPLYQVDENKVHNIQEIKNKIVDKKRIIKWLVAGVNGNSSELLYEILNGKSVVFQYYIPDGTIKETVFLLEGIHEAINAIAK